MIEIPTHFAGCDQLDKLPTAEKRKRYAVFLCKMGVTVQDMVQYWDVLPQEPVNSIATGWCRHGFDCNRDRGACYLYRLAGAAEAVHSPQQVAL